MACVALLLSVLAVPPASAKPPVGSKVEELTFKDIRYLQRSVRDLGAEKAVVLVFTTNSCPLVHRYLPVLQEIDRKYRHRGVRFAAVNVGSADDLKSIAETAVERRIEFPMVKDVGLKVVAALGVERTPEIVVLDHTNVLRYRGRIDDQFRIGGERPSPSRNDLCEAIDDVLAGKPVRVAETPVDGCRIGPPSSVAPPKEPIDYAAKVAPILAKHCQECHKPGAMGPFSLGTHKEIASHAATIAEVVADERMPPWYGATAKGPFANQRGMTAEEKEILIGWVRQGAPAGDHSKHPSPPKPETRKWAIGEPDRIVTMVGRHSIPATGIVPYRYLVLPEVFTHDVWLEAIEIGADNPKVLHHCNLGYFNLGGDVRRPMFITGKVPGGDPMVLGKGIAFRIPAGAMLGLQAHYTTDGKPETCQLSVGLRFARSTVQKQLRHLQVANTRFSIPPGEPAWEVAAQRTLPCDATGVGMFCHMHVRGRDMTFYAHPPKGPRETLLCIPNYNFDWQQSYHWPDGVQKFAKGTRIQCVAHYDNSPFNPFNPDASATVPEGQQTHEEMLYGFFFYTDDSEKLNLSIDPKTGAPSKASSSRLSSSPRAAE